MIIEAAKRKFNSDKICRSYSDWKFGVTFLEHSVNTEKKEAIGCDSQLVGMQMGMENIQRGTVHGECLGKRPEERLGKLLGGTSSGNVLLSVIFQTLLN